MRKYQPIWERLKVERVAQVSAPPKMHARIIKAVRKEKWEDHHWRRMLRNQNYLHHIESTRKGEIITFNLVLVKQFMLTDLV
jgi:hypothetical protein